MMRSLYARAGVVATAWLLVAGTGCFDEPLLMAPKDAGDLDGGDEDAGTLGSICDDALDGFACGAARICLHERCVESRCGDGIRVGAEACDDGNQRIDDDCTPSCRLIPGVCGDGRTGVGEQCDDGNRIDDDSCSNLCHPHEVSMDAGAPSIADGCPRLDGAPVVTPYVGEDERLVGRFFTIEARVTSMPGFLQWFHADGFGDIYRDNDDPLRIKFACTTPAAEQDATVYFSGIDPYCTPVATSVTVTCGPPFVLTPGTGGDADGGLP